MEPSPPGDPSALLQVYLATADVPCPGCGYNLRGVTDSACPECGEPLRLDLQRDLIAPRTALLAGLALALLLTVYTAGLGAAVPVLWRNVIAGMPAPSGYYLWSLIAGFVGLLAAAVAAGNAVVARVRAGRAASRRAVVDGLAVAVVIQASITLLWRLVDYF